MATIQHATAIGVTGVAAYTDVKAGSIPNWLTYPLFAVGPAIFWFQFGVNGVWDSALGILVCGLVPLMMWRSGGMGGGEVKLLAGLGALTGFLAGIEIEFYAMAAGAIGGLVILARRRRLIPALANLFFMIMNRLLPRKWRRDVTKELKHEVRIGPYILAGTVVAVALRHPQWVGMAP